MELEAIDLHDEPLVAPQEVDLVAEDSCVHLGGRQPGRANKGEKAFLGLGARDR